MHGALVRRDVVWVPSLIVIVECVECLCAIRSSGLKALPIDMQDSTFVSYMTSKFTPATVVRGTDSETLEEHHNHPSINHTPKIAQHMQKHSR